jgi:vacuolar-type H+-ATPase subunit H
VRELSERLSALQAEAGRGRETEDILHRTLLLAQRAADEAVAEAQQRARQMVEEAELQSRKMLAEAEADARRRGETERRRLEEEILELAARRDALLDDVESLTRFENEYRDRMARALEADLAALRQRPSSAPGPQPEPHDVELPGAAERVARREPPPTGASGEHTRTGEEDAGPPTRPVPAPALFERPQPAADAPPEASAAPGTAAASAPSPSPERPADAPSLDLLADDEAAEAEVLDDDAFFATLREAVHDDAPLGPRDEGEDEQRREFLDDDRSSFRDVFRRRR